MAMSPLHRRMVLCTHSTSRLGVRNRINTRRGSGLQKAERESPGHCMPGMNRRSFKGGEGRKKQSPRLDGKRLSW